MSDNIELMILVDSVLSQRLAALSLWSQMWGIHLLLEFTTCVYYGIIEFETTNVDKIVKRL